MRKLGISIYPDKADKQEIMDYIKKAHDHGFSRIFTCLLSVEKSKSEIIEEFKEIHTYAKSLDYEIIVDVAPRIFKALEISYDELSFFNEVMADGIRLDLGFTGAEEAMMTFNPYGLKIEVNMSMDTNTINTIMDYKPNRHKLVGCHNFYPHQLSGLPLDFFRSCTNRFKQHGLRTAAFITSQAENTFGPWPVTQGLPTLEMHRTLPIDVQLKHMIAEDTIDDIIISNCYPTDEEFAALKKISLDCVSFKVIANKDASELERIIMFEEFHFNRGDINEYTIRSTQSRVKYKGEPFPLYNPVPQIKRGDIIIESSEYGHYAGELQIAKQDMSNSGLSNVVGRISDDELFLLDMIAPWQKFRLYEK